MSRLPALIRESFPSFADEFSLKNKEEASDSRMMADLASHVVALYATNHLDEVRSAFALAEQLIVSGSEQEKHAGVIGFLETVQNVASHRQFGIAAFEPFLGPASEKWWTELIDQWSGKSTLAEVVASERGVTLRPRWWQFWRKRSSPSPREMLEKAENPELRKIIEQITRE